MTALHERNHGISIAPVARIRPRGKLRVLLLGWDASFMNGDQWHARSGSTRSLADS
jgi:hypothetical protein